MLNKINRLKVKKKLTNTKLKKAPSGGNLVINVSALVIHIRYKFFSFYILNRAIY